MQKPAYLIILLLLLFPFFNLSPSIASLEGASPPPSSFFSGGSGSAEDETIDSFDIHPRNRWDITDTRFDYITCADSLLNLTEVGDYIADSISLKRKLAKDDDKIEIRFKFESNATTTFTANGLKIGLYPSVTEWVWLDITNINSTDAKTTLTYRAINAASQELVLSGDEKLKPDYWYLLKLDYDFLRSKIKFKVYFENNTKVFDYDWQDISEYMPAIFNSPKVWAYLQVSGIGDGDWNPTTTVLFDYVKAPFAENIWEQSTVGSDTDWLQEQPLGVRVQDDILGEYSIWDLTVPRLDVVSGTMFNGGAIFTSVNDVEASISIAILGVDANDGDLHEVGRIKLRKQYGGTAMNFSITKGGSISIDEYLHGTIAFTPRAEFSLSLIDERSLLEIKGRCWPDHTDEDSFSDVFGVIDVADYVDDPSTEFVIRTSYYCDFTADIEFSMNFEEFGFVARDIFADIGRAIGNLITGFFEFIFVGLFRFLAGIFRIIGELIIAAVNALQPFLTIISDAIDTLWTIADEIAGWASGILTDIFNEFANIGEHIWTWFEGIISDVADWMYDILELVIPALLGFLETIVTGLLELAWVLWYGMWAAVGLEGIFEIGDVLFTGIAQFITGLPTLINDWMSFLVALWYLISVFGVIVFFGFPLKEATIGGYIDCMFDYMAFDLTFGISAAGFGGRVPAVAIWFLFVIATVLSNTLFVGFF